MLTDEQIENLLCEEPFHDSQSKARKTLTMVNKAIKEGKLASCHNGQLAELKLRVKEAIASWL